MCDRDVSRTGRPAREQGGRGKEKKWVLIPGVSGVDIERFGLVQGIGGNRREEFEQMLTWLRDKQYPNRKPWYTHDNEESDIGYQIPDALRLAVEMKVISPTTALCRALSFQMPEKPSPRNDEESIISLGQSSELRREQERNRIEILGQRLSTLVRELIVMARISTSADDDSPAGDKRDDLTQLVFCEMFANRYPLDIVRDVISLRPKYLNVPLSVHDVKTAGHRIYSTPFANAMMFDEVHLNYSSLLYTHSFLVNQHALCADIADTGIQLMPMQHVLAHMLELYNLLECTGEEEENSRPLDIPLTYWKKCVSIVSSHPSFTYSEKRYIIPTVNKMIKKLDTKSNTRTTATFLSEVFHGHSLRDTSSRRLTSFR